MAKKATTTKENPVEEKSIDMTPEMEELKKQVDGLKLENEELTKATKEWKEKYEELLAEEPEFTPEPYLVVIPFKAGEAQGNELMLAIRGWMKHFKEQFRIVVVGDVEDLELPGLEGDCLEIMLIPHECKTDNPPLDIVSKLLSVVEECPEVENIILTNDDIYPVNDFDVTEVKMLKADGLLTSNKKCGELYALNRGKTLKMLQEKKLPVFDYGSHLPMFFEVEKLLDVIEKYDLRKEAMLLSSLYFNTVFPSRIPMMLDMSRDHLKVIVGRKNANLRLLREYIPKKVFVNNSVSGWSEELEKIISEFV